MQESLLHIISFMVLSQSKYRHINFIDSTLYISHRLWQEEALDDLEKNLDKEFEHKMFMMAFPHLHNLLSSLQKHLLAYCFTQQPWKPHTSPAAELLFKHTSLMFIVTKSLLDKALVLMQHENCNSSVIIAIEG